MNAQRLLLITALSSLLVAGVQAVPLEAHARSISMSGQLHMDGDFLAMLLVGEEGALERLDLEAGSAQMLRWSTVGVYAGCAGGACPQQSLLVDDTPERTPAEPARDVRMELAGQPDPGHRIAVFPQGDATLTFQGKRIVTVPDSGLCLREQGYSSGTTGCSGYDEQQVGFSQVPLAGPIQHVNGSGERMVLRGDLIIEMEGIHLSGEGLAFDTTQQRTGGSAGSYERQFGRVLLEDAELRFEVGGPLQLEWVLRHADTMARGGHVSVTGASGSVALLDGRRGLADEDTLSGDFVMRSSAVDGAIAFGIEPRGPDGMPLAAGSPSEPAGPLAAALLASLIPLFGIALAVRRHQAHTSMHDVERALGAGRYGRASRLSQRIIRRDPMDESALLSRAIALTRAGRPAKAVHEVRAFLARKDPSDGTLHYAMGVALLDLEDSAAAQQALERAAQITPSLRAEIGAGMFSVQDDAYT